MCERVGVVVDVTMGVGVKAGLTRCDREVILIQLVGCLVGRYDLLFDGRLVGTGTPAPEPDIDVG
jgi:hypothetical protein